MALAFMLLLQWLSQAERMRPLREERNQNNRSGEPLEEIEWKKYSGCMR
jgi:hypothetical protein